mmetsp:Transcript_98814/g.235548  ORF Transcript_98814/g.235548 Transcript_98814/m.235548 type:complete len:451 (-) Transcript_98814:1037-2389(-)
MYFEGLPPLPDQSHRVLVGLVVVARNHCHVRPFHHHLVPCLQEPPVASHHQAHGLVAQLLAPIMHLPIRGVHVHHGSTEIIPPTGDDILSALLRAVVGVHPRALRILLLPEVHIRGQHLLFQGVVRRVSRHLPLPLVALQLHHTLQVGEVLQASEFHLLVVNNPAERGIWPAREEPLLAAILLGLLPLSSKPDFLHGEHLADHFIALLVAVDHLHFTKAVPVRQIALRARAINPVAVAHLVPDGFAHWHVDEVEVLFGRDRLRDPQLQRLAVRGACPVAEPILLFLLDGQRFAQPRHQGDACQLVPEVRVEAAALHRQRLLGPRHPLRHQRLEVLLRVGPGLHRPVAAHASEAGLAGAVVPQRLSVHTIWWGQSLLLLLVPSLVRFLLLIFVSVARLQQGIGVRLLIACLVQDALNGLRITLELQDSAGLRDEVVVLILRNELLLLFLSS